MLITLYAGTFSTQDQHACMFTVCTVTVVLVLFSRFVIFQESS